MLGQAQKAKPLLAGERQESAIRRTTKRRGPMAVFNLFFFFRIDRAGRLRQTPYFATAWSVKFAHDAVPGLEINSLSIRMKHYVAESAIPRCACESGRVAFHASSHI